jgi:type II secretory pathway pseudopilin PulG
MTVFSVAVIILAILIALLLSRLRPRVAEASSHNFDMDQASAMSSEVWNSLPQKTGSLHVRHL